MEHALAKCFRARNDAIKSLCSSVHRFRDATIKEKCKGDYPQALQAMLKALDRAEDLIQNWAMCGPYRRTTAEEELARRYHIPIPPQRDLPISWNIAPSQDVLAIRFNTETKQRSLDALRWGLIPYWAKDPKIAYRTINARAESVDTAPSYRQAFKKRRGLIPFSCSQMLIVHQSLGQTFSVDTFYEWKKVVGDRSKMLVGFGQRWRGTRDAG